MWEAQNFENKYINIYVKRFNFCIKIYYALLKWINFQGS